MRRALRLRDHHPPLPGKKFAVQNIASTEKRKQHIVQKKILVVQDEIAKTLMGEFNRGAIHRWD